MVRRPPSACHVCGSFLLSSVSLLRVPALQDGLLLLVDRRVVGFQADCLVLVPHRLFRLTHVAAQVSAVMEGLMLDGADGDWHAPSPLPTDSIAPGRRGRFPSPLRESHGEVSERMSGRVPGFPLLVQPRPVALTPAPRSLLSCCSSPT